MNAADVRSAEQTSPCSVAACSPIDIARQRSINPPKRPKQHLNPIKALTPVDTTNNDTAHHQASGFQTRTKRTMRVAPDRQEKTPPGVANRFVVCHTRPMPGTSAKSQSLNVRIPIDLMDWIEAQGGSKGELVVRAIQALRQASMPKPKSNEPIDRKRTHAAGSLLSSAVPTNIEGEVAWCGLKRTKKE